MTNQEAVDVEGVEGVEGAEEPGRSTIRFPYADQDAAIRVAKGVHHFGTSCTLAQLAAQLGGMTVNGGGFRQMVTAAQIFGLVTLSRQTVTLTVLGQRINDQDQEKAARAESYLAVPLYREVFDRFSEAGGKLPPQAGLEAEMVKLGVLPKIVDRARQVFQRSAQQAGFLAFGPDKLVMPAIGGGTPKADPAARKKDEERHRSGDGGGDGGGGDRHPFIAGLLKELPAEGAEWATEDRVKWLQAAAMIFDLIYKNGGGKNSKIDVSTGSAK